jgi:hypothetical protein
LLKLVVYIITTELERVADNVSKWPVFTQKRISVYSIYISNDMKRKSPPPPLYVIFYSSAY